MVSRLGNHVFGFCACGIFAICATASLHAQTGTRGSVDFKNQGLILQNGGLDLSQPPLNAPQQFQTNTFPFPSATTPVQVPAIAPPTIETSNARGSVISFDQGSSQNSSFGSTIAPPVIASGPSVSNGVVTPVSATEFTVRNFEGGVGDNLPIVDESYATLDRGGVIEDTSFGRPVGEIRNATTIAADTVILSDGTIVRNSNGTTGVASLPAALRNSEPSYVGGVKPGVRVAIPRPKGTPPRRSTNVARSTTSTTTTKPTTSIFVQKPVQPATPKQQSTISRTPKVTKFVSGNALGLADEKAPTQTTPKVASVEPATPKATTTAQAAKPDPLKIRILFSPNSIELQEQVKPALGQLAGQLKTDTDMQIQLLSYASGENARRLSLTRALAVRANLIAQGIDSSRMIVKARGDKSDGGQADRLDIIEVN